MRSPRNGHLEPVRFGLTTHCAIGKTPVLLCSRRRVRCSVSFLLENTLIVSFGAGKKGQRRKKEVTQKMYEAKKLQLRAAAGFV